uniref:Uncharacterized protein n=1 Tax=Triticum urartu TaxID=4572 RepID=A0A8R7Q5W3_TRIUA
MSLIPYWKHLYQLPILRNKKTTLISPSSSCPRMEQCR